MSNSITRYLIAVLLLCVPAEGGHAQAIQAPAESLGFAVIGDFGSGTPQQYEVASLMAAVRARSRYDMVLTAGDNIYGGWNRRAVIDRFETPYRRLLDGGVSFFASLGNHDGLEERQYPLFNMGGERYYSFTRLNVQFFALDSNYMNGAQLTWVRRGLEASTAPWKIAFFHHPLYSSARRHGAQTDLRGDVATGERANAVRRLVRRLEREVPGPVRMCYEARPSGYALQRQATTPRVY